MAFAALAAVGLGAAEGNAVVHGYIVADDGGFADDHAHTVVDKQTSAYLRTGVDFNTCEPPPPLRKHTCNKFHAVLIEKMCRTIP